MDALILFPHQLFDLQHIWQGSQTVYLLEDPLFFCDPIYPANFHRQRLIFHRASMQAYASSLKQRGYRVHYFDYPEEGRIQDWIQTFLTQGVHCLHLFDPADFILEKRWRKALHEAGIELKLHPSPGFLCDRDELPDLLGNKETYSHSSFYIRQRKKLKVLVEAGKPQGGKWSFDSDNRKKLPKSLSVPEIMSATDHQTWLEPAKSYIQQRFPDALGKSDPFIYPITHAGAAHWLDTFLEQRLNSFGDYEDALSVKHDHVFHSLLSPLLNSGLLTPLQVLHATLRYAQTHAISLNNLEGFLRQIIGWREYIRAVYQISGVKIRTRNYWNHKRPMPKSFYTGTTGIFPIDHLIHKLQNSAYAHHIERLMVLGNFMCLCEIHPDAIYTWFMEYFIDAYDWVMVPNVYGMSQYADGGLLTTKPYISSSNYLRKMSDYPPGPWTEIWDGLYWRFIYKHQDFFRQNPRLGVMVHQLNQMPADKLQGHLARAEAFLEQL